MTTFNGHKNWTQWNVSLWINNDESLYRLALAFKRRHTVDEAAELMLEHLKLASVTETLDGAKFSKTAIKAAMRGM